MEQTFEQAITRGILERFQEKLNDNLDVDTAITGAGAATPDRQMSEFRKDFDWKKQFELALDPERARKRREASESSDEEYCSMCGKLCALRTNRGDNY
ncbi:MAG: phosphomethylpyrimidine synthase ThiC [Spirochaetales bacterium]|nr:phosphomethylpyrimidine synthase ThiC [Spirochaetales bacterium]